MKKKRIKKLVLSRETLGALDEPQIKAVIGATGGGDPGSGCLFTCESVYTCGRPTRQLDCTDYC